MLGNVRYFVSDLIHWLGRHRLAGAVIAVLVVAAAAGAYLLAASDSGGDDAATAPAPRVVVDEETTPGQTEALTDLGFPAFATKNTTRVAGADGVADAAAVALAVHPSTGGVSGPNAVSLVDAGDWRAAIAAASLTAAPVGAPILYTQSGELPELSAQALRALDPKGSSDTAGREAFVIGAAAKPDGYESLELSGSDPAKLAAEIDRLRQRLAGEPQHIVLASSKAPAYAMPAAAWAARSGDPVLFTGRDELPAATLKSLKSHARVPVFLLGPAKAISDDVLDQVAKLYPAVERVGAEGATESSIAFARYASGSFGWNINDPGHGLVIASATRPLDAAAAAPLSASGTWGPLLVTDERGGVPDALRGFMLDVKPGYESDPTRALYNHVWLIGDSSAISLGFQAQVDELAELAPVTSGSGASAVAPPPGAPESDREPDQSSKPEQGADRGHGGEQR